MGWLQNCRHISPFSGKRTNSGLPMKKHIVVALVFGAITLMGGTQPLSAQWSDFKKGLRKEVKVAIESDTLLVAHHDGIAFSFIATIDSAASSDIFRRVDASGNVFWQLTGRFWDRLQQSNQPLTALFEPAFIENLHNPTDFDLEEELAIQQAATEALQSREKPQQSPREKLLTSIAEANARGDREVASLLRMIYQEQFQALPDSLEVTPLETSVSESDREEPLPARLYAKALEYERAGAPERALAVYENLLDLGEYRDARLRADSLRAVFNQKQAEAALARLYRQGIEAIAREQWVHAITIFEHLQQEQADYRDVVRRLRQARRGLALSKQTAAPPTNGHAHEGDNATAKQPPMTAAPKDPPGIQAGRGHEAHGIEGDVLAALYEQAEAQVARRDWPAAKIILERLLAQAPAYRHAPDLLQIVEKNLSGKQRGWIGSLGIASCMVLLVVGIAYMVVPWRARLFVLLGQGERAIALYERMKQKNPGNRQVYRRLGALYLRYNRHDENALELFKTIKKLNLRVPYRAQLEVVLQSVDNAEVRRERRCV